MNICVYGASSENLDEEYIREGEKLGELMGKKGHGLIFGGGAHGLMGAVSRGVARSENGKVIGVAPRFFDVNGILAEYCTEFIFTETMRERKSIMEEKADAFIMAPGGIGTFEEFFEILTLKQLGKLNKPIAIFNSCGYYDDILKMLEKAVAEKFMREQCMDIFMVTEDIGELIDYIENCGKQDLSHLKNI